MSHIIKFSGPKEEIKFNFRNLPTPMVEWKGTAKELHDILMKAWVESEPEAALSGGKGAELANPVDSEPLPCPFCGSANVKLDHLTDADDYFVSCGDCEVQQIANYTQDIALQRWNNRPSRYPVAKELPFKCDLCGKMIESADDRTFFHGLGNCVQICERCTGSGIEPATPKPIAEAPDDGSCAACGGAGA